MTCRPYPRIMENPGVKNVLDTWNRADTGLVITFALLGLFLGRKGTSRNLELITLV